MSKGEDEMLESFAAMENMNMDTVSVPREPTDSVIEMLARLLAKVRGHSSADAIIDAEDGSRPAWTFYRGEAQTAYKLAQIDSTAPRISGRGGRCAGDSGATS